jgi:TetR/AcrR family transcriptional regulator, regulator of cefoperazone and chloramphenicol sensitivity
MASQLDTRERLLRAAVDVFGRYGYAGTSTRMLASAAEVNLQAIPYHFGGKEGLYAATATYIAGHILERTKPWRESARARLGQGPITVVEAKAILVEMMSGVAGVLLDERTAPIARFVVREQMDPTAAFDPLYGTVMEPQLEIARKLVGLALGADPRSQRVKLRTLSLISSVIFFRIGQAAALRQMGWKEIGPRELTALRAMFQEVVESLGEPRGKS